MTTGVVTAVTRRWSSFWFGTQSAVVLAFWRAALGFTALVWALSLAPDLIAFYGEDGLKPNPFYGDYRIGLFQWFESNTALYLIYALMIASAVSLLVGRWVRIGAVALWFCVMSFQLDNTNVLNAGDELLRIWTAYFALYALLTPSRFVSVPLFGTPDGEGNRTWVDAPVWLIRLAQIQLTIIYPFSVYAKFEGDTWIDGTATARSLQIIDFERFWVPGFVRDGVVISFVITWLTLVLEVVLPLLLWNRRTRRLGIASGLLLHASFQYALRVGFFGWSMAIGYIAFLRPHEVVRILGWLRPSIRDELAVERPQLVNT